MIHDILLSCLNLHSKHLPIEEFVVSDAVSTFLHPCEKKILEDIIRIVNLLRDVAKFTKLHGTNQDVAIVDNDESLQNGLYLRAFVNGTERVLDGYLGDIAIMEMNYLSNPSQTLMSIYQKLQNYEPLALYLAKLIRGICINKLHGCAILQYLQQNCLHGDAKIYKAVKTIQSSVNVIFLKQLTHWILYAKIADTYGEFFIQSPEIHNDINNINNNNNNNSGISRAKKNESVGTSCGSGKQTMTTMLETSSAYADIWRYEIFYEFLPQYLSSNWAEKVLFIGQTVLMFKVDANKFHKNIQMWNNINNNITLTNEGNHSLWNGREHIYFGKIQALQYDIDLNVSHYERIIDEIKTFVTTRLSEIAINQADLVKQLKLIKDFYLLGRGELFLEFIRQTYLINKMSNHENKLRDYVKAFDIAAHAVGITEDLEQFTLFIPKANLDNCTIDSHEFGYIEVMQLQYKINWPLHLLFSPKVIERYNVLFRFLLLIKKLQYELHMLWCQHTRATKNNTNYRKFDDNLTATQTKIIHLRNQLMFFVDNLQYYIQVDVLESQFSILLQTILNKADFEQIQKAHSIFQANVLSSCFLIHEEDIYKGNTVLSQPSSISFVTNNNNPVHLLFNEIFHVCQDFCNLIDVHDTILDANNADEIDKKVDELDLRFGTLMKQLINLLVGFKTAPNITPLSQLLLQLDFNHWFSVRKRTK